jgi:hypothetical protein
MGKHHIYIANGGYFYSLLILQENSLAEFGDNSKIDVTEIDSEGWWWMEPTQDNFQWQTLVLAVLNIQSLLPVRDITFYLWIGYQIQNCSKAPKTSAK